MEVVCPSCGEALEAPAGMRDGQHLQCTMCGGKFCIRGGFAEPIPYLQRPRAVPCDECPKSPGHRSFYKLSGESEWRNYAWRRWAARLIDFYCGYVISMCVFYGLAFASGATGVCLQFWTWIAMPEHAWVDYVLTTMLSYYASVVVYALFGTTLGKKTCGLLVADAVGRPMCTWDYFVREVRVMFFGEWMCIPLLSAFAFLHQFHMVTQAGYASYDANWSRSDCYPRPTRGKSGWDGLLVPLVLIVGAILRMIF